MPGGLAPHAPVSQYQHNRTGEDNADAHLKRQIMGREVVFAVTNGRLDFGTWERILGVSWVADTGVSTGAGGSGYWSRSSASRRAQSYHERNRLWLWYATTKRWSVRHNGRG